MPKQNCWEVLKCGREPGGANAKDLGECPASAEHRIDGIHGGKNGGRACWAIVGTFCENKVQGTFAQKYLSCTHCEFYKLVRKETGKECLDSMAILKRLK